MGLGSNYNKILERDLKVQDSRKCPKCVPGKLVRNSLMGEKKLGYITFQCFSCNYCLYQKLMFTGEKEYSIKRID